MPFPRRKASIWEAGISGGGGGSKTAFEKGYTAVLLDKCLMNVLHDFENMVTGASDSSSVQASYLIDYGRQTPSQCPA